MAAKVNTKFVLMLSVVALLAIGAVWATLELFVRNTGADLVRAGDKKMVAAQYKDAADIYAKAVNKEKTNVEFLKKWIEALKKSNRETPRAYAEAYTINLVYSAQRQLAIVSGDVAAQREYLEARREIADSIPFSRDAYEEIIKDAGTILQKHTTPTPESERLKRYPGLARVRIALNVPDASPELIAEAKTQLEAALAADPSDEEVAQGLTMWHSMHAAKARAAKKPEEADGHDAKAKEVVAQFLAKNPDSTLMGVMSLRQEMETMIRSVVTGDTRTDFAVLRDAGNRFATAAKPKLDLLAANATKQAAKVPTRAVALYRELEQLIDPASNLARTESVIRAMLASRPQEAEIHMLLGDVIDSRRDYPEAVAAYQKIVDMPVPALSAEGFLLWDRKSQAMFRQVQSLFRQTQATNDKTQRDAAIAKIKELREQLGKQQDAASPAMLLTDAQIALLDGDNPKADRLISQFNKTTDHSVPDGLMLAADIAIKSNKLGAARDYLKQVIGVQSSNMLAALRLAEVERLLANFPEAIKIYKAILQSQPDNKVVQERLAELEGMTGTGKVSDPVLQVIIDSDKMAKEEGEKPGGNARVVEFIRTERAKLKSDDTRLIRAEALAEVRNNNKAGAIEVIRKGLQIHPDSPELKMFEIGLAQSDELTASLQMVDLRAGTDEIEKALGHFAVYRQFNKDAEAKLEIQKAVKLAPNDKRVVEVEFLQALDEKNWTRADELVQRAVKNDLDGCNGDTFRSRLESAKGNGEEAVRIMQEAVARGGVQPEVYRLLGHMQLGLGRSNDAIANFREALRLRPNDLPILKDLLATMIQYGRAEDALGVARSTEHFANADADFVHMWLNLEGAIGDRPMAIKRRANLYRINAEDRDNSLALAALYMESKDYAAARPIIDTIRRNADGIDVVNLDASWHWAQRDTAKAKQVFETYLASIDNSKLTPELFFVYAQFLRQRQDLEGTFAVLERARAYQDAKTADVDRAISDLQFSLNRAEETAAACRRIIEAKADTPNHLYRKRLVECYLALGKAAEANDVLTPMLSSSDVDAVTMLLASEVKKSQGDAKGQRELLDRAVQRFPSDASVFLKRGQAALDSADSRPEAERAPVIRDAIADLTKAIQLNPTMWQALRVRALAYDKLKDPNKAMADLRAALDVNPVDNELLAGLLSYLLKENRDQDALEVANRVLEKRQRDAGAFMGVASIFGGAGRHEHAIRYMERAFVIDPQDAVAINYLGTLLNATPPALAQAEALFNNQLKDRIAKNPGLLMARAKLYFLQNKNRESLFAARESLSELNVADARQMHVWFGELRRFSTDSQKVRRFLEDLVQGGVATEWLAYFRASMMVDDPTVQTQGLEILKDLRASQNRSLRQYAHRGYTGALYNLGKYDEAAAGMQAALADYPDDLEVMNNLAYTLAKRLNKPQEALPLAEKVAQARPTGDVLDTLAMCHLLMGKHEEALTQLQKAEGTQLSPNGAVSVQMHKAEALWALNRKDEAKSTLAGAVKIAENNPAALSPQAKSDLEEVRKRIGTP